MSSPAFWIRRFTFALVALAPFASAGAAAQTAAPAPDMSAYDCTAAMSAPQRKTLHIAQVIEGKYYEWNEVVVPAPSNAEGSPQWRAACISLLRPDARSLGASEAAEFLKRSAAIGAPSATPQAANLGKKNSAPSTPFPRDVPPEPLHHAIRPSSTGQQQAAPATREPVAPPTPVEARPSPLAAFTPDSSQKQQSALGQSLAGSVSTSPGARDITGSEISTYPNNLVGFLVVRFPDGEEFRCTGFVVSPYVVLTAGHCLYNTNRGGWASGVAFYPAVYQDIPGGEVVQPYPMNNDVAYLKVTQEWMAISGPDILPVTDYRYDFAAIEFNTPFNYTSTFLPVLFNDSTQFEYSAGYPANLPTISQPLNGQYETGGFETAESLSALGQSDIREFNMAVDPGDSGSPIWDMTPLPAPASAELSGSVSYADSTGAIVGGPWYDSWNQPLLTSWMAWTPGNATTSAAPSNTPSIEATAAASLGNPASASFLRFYNAGTTAGTATVTLANGATGQNVYTWTSPSVAPGSVIQASMAAIENLIPPVMRGANYSLSIQPGFSGYFQHVLWNASVGALTDLSTCDTTATSDPQLLMNVHSSRVGPEYPSLIVLHNIDTAPTDVTLGIYDGRNGARLGGYRTVTIPANGQITVAMTAIEQAVQIFPPPDLIYYTIKVESGFKGYLQHLVNNVAVGVISDMSAVCTLNG